MARPLVRSAVSAATLALTAGLAACASQPTTNAALEQAHQRLSQLQQDANARQYASTALGEAQQSLAAADNAFRQGDTTRFNHEVFMTDRALQTAEAQTEAQTARAKVAQLGETRDQTLLQTKSAQLAQAQKELQAYKTRETSQGTVVTLYDLPFATSKATLQPGAAIRLQPLVSYLKQHPDRQVIVQGNTDSTGRPSTNQELSQRRADAVRNFLISSGIGADRIIARGLGSSYPVASNDTSAGRQENRRVDVLIEPSQSTAALPEAAPPTGGDTGTPPTTGR